MKQHTEADSAALLPLLLLLPPRCMDSTSRKPLVARSCVRYGSDVSNILEHELVKRPAHEIRQHMLLIALMHCLNRPRHEAISSSLSNFCHQHKSPVICAGDKGELLLDKRNPCARKKAPASSADRDVELKQATCTLVHQPVIN